MIDLTKISDKDLAREYWRRINAKRTHTPGRKRVLRPCEFCGKEFGAREMLSHGPSCKRKHIISDVMQFIPSAAKKAGRA